VTEPAVEIVDLVKRYGTAVAVDGLSLTAERGAVTALLGPNGAGKTTTVEICEGYRRPDGGRVRVLGLDPIDQGRRLKPRVGVMLQNGVGYPGARVREMLGLLASFAHDPLPPAVLLEALGLQRVAGAALRKLSGGERQRLSLAMALVGRPELLVLDEPTAGLDVQARRATWELVRQLRDDGACVLLTTHYLEEAERLADHVVIVDRGRVAAAGPPALLAGEGAGLRFRAPAGLDRDGSLTAALPAGCVVVESPPGEYRVTGRVDPGVLAAVTGWCAARGVLVEEMRSGARSLEEVFVELTGRAGGE
jgi:ABC-2 type transport system ATP-binding protein